MTVSVQRTVHCWCDHCGEIIGSADLGDRTAAEARRKARVDGAHTGLPGGRDVCGECWQEGKR